MSTPTGANRGGGVKRGLGGPARGGTVRGSTGGANGVPLAAQFKQLQRLDEPKEMAFFRRFVKLGLTTVESVYGPTGLLETKLRVPRENFRSFWGLNPPANGPSAVLSLVQGEQVLRAIEAHETRERALSRREARLGSAFAQTPWADLSADDREKLLLSNSEYRKRYPNVRAGGDAGDDESDV